MGPTLQPYIKMSKIENTISSTMKKSSSGISEGGTSSRIAAVLVVLAVVISSSSSAAAAEAATNLRGGGGDGIQVFPKCVKCNKLIPKFIKKKQFATKKKRQKCQKTCKE